MRNPFKRELSPEEEALREKIKNAEQEGFKEGRAEREEKLIEEARRRGRERGERPPQKAGFSYQTLKERVTKIGKGGKVIVGGIQGFADACAQLTQPSEFEEEQKRRKKQDGS